MKQCLFLESGGVYKKLVRINRTKNIITGAFFNSVVRAVPGLKDFHFTYPPVDGGVKARKYGWMETKVERLL